MNKNFKYTLLSFVSMLMFSNEISAQTAPSFDCTKATSEVEKLICSDDELAKLDIEMNKSYHAFMKTLDDDFYRDKLKTKQQDWMSYRGKLSCMNTSDKYKINCLKRAYQTRIDNLTAWTKRENYDFFRDCYEYSHIYKFIARDGQEYLISPNCHIYPDFPKHEKIYCKKGYSSLKHDTDVIYFWQSEHRILVGGSYGDSDSIDGKDKYKIENFPDKVLLHYPKNVDETALFDEFKEYLKNMDVQENVNKYAYNGMNKEKCIDFLAYLKENKNQITLMPTIKASAPKEMIDKVPLHCTRQQYEKLLFSPKYPSLKYILAFNLVYVPIFENKGILGGVYVNRSALGHARTKYVLINPQTCKVLDNSNRSERNSPQAFIIKFQNKYIVVSKGERGLKGPWEIGTLTTSQNNTSCNF